VTLTDIARGLFDDTFVKEDPLLHNKTYGVIQNPYVKRRKGKRPTISEAPEQKTRPVEKALKAAAKSPTTVEVKAIPTPPTLNKEDGSRPDSRDNTSTKDTRKPNLKRDASDIFKAFAKQKSKPISQLQRQDTDASTNASASGTEDTKMPDADEEGQSEDEALFLDTNTHKPGTKKRMSEVKAEREDKAAKLRKMMDSDDDEPAVPNVEDAAGVKEAPVVAKKGGEQAETHDDEDDEVAWSDSENERQRQRTGKKDVSAHKEGEQIDTAPKRRRGKRKVMKKRTMKDEEGYLVTKEEAAWESFSEEEPEPVKAEKPKPTSNLDRTGSAATAKPSSQKSVPVEKKGKKGGAGGGGGNIMSFFGKKT